MRKKKETKVGYRWESITDDSRKKKDTAQIPDRATNVYTIRLKSAPCPPNKAATRSNWNSPMLPQFKAPIMMSARAILSSILIQLLVDFAQKIVSCLPGVPHLCSDAFAMVFIVWIHFLKLCGIFIFMGSPIY